jgi:hypothetical protein
MDAFARLERMTQLATQSLLEISDWAARPVFATLMSKQSIELLEAAAKMALNEKDAERVKKLCGKLGRRNMKRNFIIHGYWTVHITPAKDGAPQTEQWIRVYDNVDPALAGEPTDPKLLGTFTFTVPELDNVTDHVEETVSDLSALVMELPLLKAQQQTPDERFRSWVLGRLAPIDAANLRLSQCRYP